jgi:adenine-specific DNA-methyltransferase
MENEKYLTEQLITYLGNKRNLLDFIGESIIDIKKELNKSKLVTFDGFAGSGIVSRYLKQHSYKVYSNDLEKYSQIITKSYLTNKSEIDFQILEELVLFLNQNKNTKKFGNGIIEELYSPKNTNSPKIGERCFYTNENAKIIDNIRRLIFELDCEEKYKELLLSNLLQKASVHTNTSGVFKGFYKSKSTNIGKFGGDGENALNRIMGEISLNLPVLSNFECEYEVFSGDINQVVKKIDNIDVTYFDPPYNQHPYGSNYHILNTICNYTKPNKISNVSGIPDDWNKSEYNYKEKAENSLKQLIEDTDSKYILLSYNNEGIISNEKIIEILSHYGEVKLNKKDYNTFRGSRNLSSRNLKVEELLYVLKKN